MTDRYQTTVPEIVRRALRLGKRDKIHYSIRPNGEAVLTRAASHEGDDPVLGRFLGFLARYIASPSERLQALDSDLVQRLVCVESVLDAGQLESLRVKGWNGKGLEMEYFNSGAVPITTRDLRLNYRGKQYQPIDFPFIEAGPNECGNAIFSLPSWDGSGLFHVIPAEHCLNWGST